MCDDHERDWNQEAENLEFQALQMRHAKLVAACKQLRNEYIEAHTDDLYITDDTFQLIFNILDEEPTNDATTD